MLLIPKWNHKHQEKKAVPTKGCCAIVMAADGGQAFTPKARSS